MAEKPRRIAIIGGGYTGVAFAIHALRATEGALTLTIIDPAEQLGRGVAYGATDPDHRINVPSERMSLFDEDRSHATRWFFARGILPDRDSTDAEGHHYLPRHHFGSYVSAVLVDTLATLGSKARFEHRRTRACTVGGTDGAWSIETSDGDALQADTVVLCFGHASPAVPCPVSAEARRHPSFIANPWAPDAFRTLDRDSDAVIVGTGLTMADVIASLDRRGHRGSLTALSRRGLLPRPHGLFLDHRDLLGEAPAPRTALGLLRLLRQRIAEDGAELGWHPAVDALRAQLPQLWARLPVPERRKVVRRLLPFWEVHRFRIAPQIQAAIERTRAAGRLAVERASPVGIGHDGDRFAVDIRRRDGTSITRAFDAVILCTGPDKDLRHNPLAASLLNEGIARLDDVGMGLAVDGESRVLDAQGRAHPTLLALGPMTRGSFGEMTGAPDITRHIERIAPDAVAMRVDRRDCAESTQQI